MEEGYGENRQVLIIAARMFRLKELSEADSRTTMYKLDNVEEHSVQLSDRTHLLGKISWSVF